jgi:phosphoglycerol transferase MdoB-like AlkP superfamily enzyme
MALNWRNSWKSRYGFAGFSLLSLLVGWFVLRLVLFATFSPATSAGETVLTFLTGLCRDLFAGLLVLLPVLFWLLITSDTRFRARWHRFFFWTMALVFWWLQVFLLFVEFFFFEEFKSRFNTVAVDYLIYPYEVFINIWESYHVGIILVICLVLGAAWVFAASRLFAGMWDRPCEFKKRLLYFAGWLAVAAVLVPTVSLKGVHIGVDRTLNEVANNGALSFVGAAWTRHLDYAAFYKTMDKGEAYARARRLLAERESQFVEPGESIRRHVAGEPSRPRLNVVLFLEESLGSEFWGCLGRADSLTPEMDKIATEEGLLFTNIYASGNRTVRGMEGVLASFPPLPGDSIVKRDRSDNVETIARMLKRDGYASLFLYGGRGLFDGMRAFAVRNGYDRFIEQKHFEHPSFTTIWGVCDEDLFARTIEECRQLALTGGPFFTTVLSVSNHKPYTYPKGKIPENPDEHKRENAVKYSDFALGQFFRAARSEGFWTNTIFVVVADHGARVYGEQSIPIRSYEIPLVIAGPAVVKKPARVGQLGCSLDVSPTVLGLLGRPYETLFFGRDLLKDRADAGRALLNHNRDVGLLIPDRLVVLGLMHTVEFYSGNPKGAGMNILKQPRDSDRELEKDAVALFQVADDLYFQRRYHLDSPSDITEEASLSRESVHR